MPLIQGASNKIAKRNILPNYGTGVSLNVNVDTSKLEDNAYVVTYQGTTTDAIQTEIFVNGETGERFSAVEDSNTYFQGYAGCQDGSQNAMFWTFTGILKNVGGTTTLIREIALKRFDAVLSDCSLEIEADNTNDALAVKVTGKSTTTIQWFTKFTYTRL